jgi:drug/metabolite transporter (DMT)-like permease
MAGWLALMLVMAIAGREAVRELNVFELMEVRSVLGFFLLYPMIHRNGGFKTLKTARLPLHIVRNLTHYAAQLGWFFALTLIPIGQVVAIEFTMPIWTALLAVSFLGERLNAARVVAVALGVVGVAVIVRPGVDHVDPGQLIALAAAVGFAVSVILVKSLTRTDSAVTIVFWMLVVQSAIGAVPALIVWRTPTAAVWPWVLVIALCGTYSHFCMTQALRHAEATMIVPMDFLRVPLSAVAGWLVFGERIDAFTIGGAALILFANLLNLRRPAPVPKGQQMATHP